MKIAYVLDDTLDKSDGVQQAVLTLAAEMRERGHEVHYIVPETNRSDLENVHVIARYMSMRFNGNSVRTPYPASKKHIRELLEKEKFDVLHVQMPYSPFLAGRVIAAASPETRIVGTFHILPYNKAASFGTRMLGFILRKNLKRFDVLYGVSKPAVEFMAKSFKVSGSVLGNPINYEFFHSFAHLKKRANRIVFVGRFDERKGVRQLVEAFRKLNDPEIELIMCGKGPLLEDMKVYANKYKLRIHFAGFVTEEEKAQYLASAQVAVFPSTAGESFGIVLIEAMSSGARVTLAGDNPGYRSVMHKWEPALFDANSTDSFAELLKLSLHSADFDNIGVEQQQYATYFDVRKIADELLSHGYVKPEVLS